jgi:methylmalonyl-CoA mutase
MSVLKDIVAVADKFDRFVKQQVDRASDPKARRELLKRWKALKDSVATVKTPTGIDLPSLALPDTDQPAEIARYLDGEGAAGEFPYVNAAYRQMYGAGGEEPTRLFAGLGLAEDTNRRFHFLTKQQRSVRLSTAFDGPTIYGLDCDHDGVRG